MESEAYIILGVLFNMPETERIFFFFFLQILQNYMTLLIHCQGLSHSLGETTPSD